MFKNLSKHLYNFKKASALTDVIKVMFLRICGILFLFGITIFLTNYYDPKVVGAYEFTRSSLFLIGGFVLLGTDQSILFFAGRFSKTEQVIALFSIYLRMAKMLFFTSLLFLAIALIVPDSLYEDIFNDSTSGSLLLKVSFCLFFYAITLLNTEFFRGFSLQEKSELYRGIFKQLPFGLGLLILLLFKNQNYVVEVFLGSFVVLALISSIEILKIYRKFSTGKDVPIKVSFKTIFKSTMPIAVSSLGFYLLISVDVFFLKIYTDFETLAYYGTSVKIIFLISTVVSTISSFFAVQIADLYVNDKKELQHILKNGVRIIAGLSLVLSLVLLCFSELILKVFGTSYTAANESLQILIVGHFLSTLCGITAVYLNMTKKQVTLQYILIATVFVNVFLNYVLVPTMGMNGAAIASALSVVLWNVCAALIVYKKDKIVLFIH
ncbi:polysaccharide biosynthesis C-terminal domain-containing protein [Leeuwenhoekiella sp. NPDC079379]|uniref:MATE family efflux transporter n=1 Tax=Leeuwenhoekiella sp. NPDC079379 TaxID=3364122 RepID=UPI0037CA13C2